MFVVSTSLPSVDIFGKAVYTFYIGQNDFTGNLYLGINVVKQLLPQVISQIVYAIKVSTQLMFLSHKGF